MSTPTTEDVPDSICDRCSVPVLSEESQEGPAGTEYEGCNVCNECYAVLESEK